VRAAFPARVGLISLTAGIVSMAAALFLHWRAPPRPAGSDGKALPPQASTREMEALWKPFLDSKTPLLISFENRLFFFSPSAGLVVRDFQTNQPAEVAQSKALNAFRDRMGADKLVETYDYADAGAVQAAFLLGRLLNREVILKYASAVGWEDVWNSNVIFVGKSTVHPTIRRVLRDADLDFYDSEFGSAVRNRHPRPTESAEYQNASTHGSGRKYGIITLLPGPQPGRQMLILTGAGAELMWALAQSVADPARVREIMSHVLSPAGERPAAFQVLIEATFESNVPIKTRYVTHHVYDAK
jgi:hypothetical protein